jgi:SAM-dependent MidA family methyltransferase
VLLAEAGPGRGTLMADALRAIAKMAPDFGAALRLHLVETSPRLRAVQAERLPGAVWHDDFSELPDGPLLLLANEFFDALPIRQFVRRGSGWTERHVDDEKFVELPAAGPSRDAEEGEIVECSEAAPALARTLGRRLVTSGGAVLLLDYGPEHSAPGDSLQALRDRRPADPLAAPGLADLTAHVDFQAIAAAARAAGAAVHGPLPQGIFLTRLGLFQRSGVLARTQPPARAGAMMEAARRLAEPDRMGRLFKAMALCHPALPTPPGFEA